MASSRFIKDTGLTVRMTSVMFLLGAVFVALVVVLMYAFRGFAPLIALAGIGMAFYQWWSSDKVAMRAMRAREVSPEEAPELHGMIDRLCAMADMPKPRVGVSDMDIPNAFATGRSPERAVVCVLNLSPVPRYEYRVGMPASGRWREALNTDSAYYGGSGVGNLGGVEAEADGWHDQPFSAELTLPPLSVCWFVPER